MPSPVHKSFARQDVHLRHKRQHTTAQQDEGGSSANSDHEAQTTAVVPRGSSSIITDGVQSDLQVFPSIFGSVEDAQSPSPTNRTTRGHTSPPQMHFTDEMIWMSGIQSDTADVQRTTLPAHFMHSTA